MKNEKSLPVSLEEINLMVSRYIKFEESIDNIVSDNSKNFATDEVQNFISSKEKNVFIFDKDSLIKLLENNQSEYLVVALGAHEKGKPSQQISDNSFTVITVACYEKQGKYHPINIPKPGEEWPHGIKQAKFEKGAEKDNGKNSFFFSVI